MYEIRFYEKGCYDHADIAASLEYVAPEVREAIEILYAVMENDRTDWVRIGRWVGCLNRDRSANWVVRRVRVYLNVM